MKTKSKLILVAGVLLLLGGMVAVLEVFHLHPQVNVGNVHALWAGGRWTEVGWGSVQLHFPDGQTGIQKDYDVGPLSIAVVKLHPK